MMDMDTQTNAIEMTRPSRWKQFFSLLLVMVMLLEFLPQTAWAAWDGSGDSSSDSSSDSSIHAQFTLSSKKSPLWDLRIKKKTL